MYINDLNHNMLVHIKNERINRYNKTFELYILNKFTNTKYKNNKILFHVILYMIYTFNPICIVSLLYT